MAKAQSEIIVKNDSENPIPTEVLAESIIAISDGMKKMRAGRLNDKALMLLIQHASPSPYRSGARVNISEVKVILQGIESLADTYLRS